MFKLLSEAMLEVHKTHRSIVVLVLTIINAVCVKLIKVFRDWVGTTMKGAFSPK